MTPREVTILNERIAASVKHLVSALPAETILLVTVERAGTRQIIRTAQLSPRLPDGTHPMLDALHKLGGAS